MDNILVGTTELDFQRLFQASASWESSARNSLAGLVSPTGTPRLSRRQSAALISSRQASPKSASGTPRNSKNRRMSATIRKLKSPLVRSKSFAGSNAVGSSRYMYNAHGEETDVKLLVDSIMSIGWDKSGNHVQKSRELSLKWIESLAEDDDGKNNDSEAEIETVDNGFRSSSGQLGENDTFSIGDFDIVDEVVARLENDDGVKEVPMKVHCFSIFSIRQNSSQTIIQYVLVQKSRGTRTHCHGTKISGLCPISCKRGNRSSHSENRGAGKGERKTQNTYRGG